MVEPVKLFLLSSSITMQNLTTVSHTTFAHVGGSKRFLGRWSPAPWDGRVADPLERRPSSPHICYHARFGRSKSDGTGVRTSNCVIHKTFVVPAK